MLFKNLFTRKITGSSTCLPAQKLDDPVFVFDLHGVLFKLDKRQVIKEFLKAPAKKNIFLLCFNPYFLYTAARLWFSTPVLEQFILSMMDKFTFLSPNREAALQVANALQPIKPTIKLIQKLHKQGYDLYIFSNIGKYSLDIIGQKFPEVLSLFKGILGSTPDDNYIAKPEHKAFIKFLHTFDLKQEHIIFVDDKPTNLSIARTFQMHTIHFSNENSIAKQINQQI
jgi:HAD superfamily hydrolase (TIGR01509 family)